MPTPMRRELIIHLAVALDEDTWRQFVDGLQADDPTANPAAELGQALAAQVGPSPFAVLADVPGVEVLTVDVEVGKVYDETEVEF